MRGENIMTKIIVAKTKYDCEHLLGQFLDESHYDVLIDEDTDCYLHNEDESSIAFKFRKNFFSKEEQEAAYTGLREAATPTQNRGLAAGPKGEKCGGREWVTEFQMQVFDLFQKEAENTAIKINVKEEIDRLRELYQNKESTRGLVWLSALVKQDDFRRQGIFSKLWDTRWDYVQDHFKGYTAYAWCLPMSIGLLRKKGFTETNTSSNFMVSFYQSMIPLIESLKTLNVDTNEYKQYGKALAQLCLTTWDTAVAFGPPPLSAEQIKNEITTTTNNGVINTYNIYVSLFTEYYEYFVLNPN